MKKSQMEQILRIAKNLNYKQPSTVATKIVDLLECLTYNTATRELEEGSQTSLLILSGIIPMPPINKVVPVEIWLPLHYPSEAPIIKVPITSVTFTNPFGCVDSQGRVVHTYLEQWNKESCLKNCLQILCKEFSKLSPVFDFQHFTLPTEAKKDLSEALASFTDLQPSWSKYADSNNETTIELKLEGALQVKEEISVPIRMWLFPSFPQTAPLVYIIAHSRKHTQDSEYDHQWEKLKHDYISSWKYPGCSLHEFLHRLTLDLPEMQQFQNFHMRTARHDNTDKKKCKLYSATTKEAKTENDRVKSEDRKEISSFVKSTGLTKETEFILLNNGFTTVRAISCLEEKDMDELHLPLAEVCLLRDGIKKLKRSQPSLNKRISATGDDFSNKSVQSCRDIFERATKTLLKPLMITEDQLTIEKEIGRGHFGVVYQGTLHRTDGSLPEQVAVKTVTLTAQSKNLVDDFVQEILQVRTLTHKNILGLKAIIMLDCIPYMVIPFMTNGDLHTYIRNPHRTITVEQLLKMALHVAHGMKYLSDHKIIHGDLAARNCMIDEDYTVKVGDFGLAKQVQLSDYHYIDKEQKRPVRWMAPETLFEYIYTLKSDVWSFGILLWELMTRGQMPYPSIVNNNDIPNKINLGYKMPCPPFAEPRIYSIMTRCWNRNQEMRPDFAAIISLLEDILSSDDQPNENEEKETVHGEERKSSTPSSKTQRFSTDTRPPSQNISTTAQPPLPPRKPLISYKVSYK